MVLNAIIARGMREKGMSPLILKQKQVSTTTNFSAHSFFKDSNTVTYMDSYRQETLIPEKSTQANISTRPKCITVRKNHELFVATNKLLVSFLDLFSYLISRLSFVLECIVLLNNLCINLTDCSVPALTNHQEISRKIYCSLDVIHVHWNLSGKFSLSFSSYFSLLFSP